MLKFWPKFYIYILFNFFLQSFVDASIIPYGCDLCGVQICVDFMGFFLSIKLLNFIHIVFNHMPQDHKPTKSSNQKNYNPQND